ncbi:YoaK family protein [Dactylosporangium sp. NPDC050688]|uniref:YoaK family protein n=1 Tax=Dactylosporangium sp. NPDC050688 TaxID=3157217 RepID=UPI0033F289BD
MSAAGGASAEDSRAEFRLPLLALAVATGVAGLMDALAVTRYGVFVANQSGNLVHVGMGLAGRDPLWLASACSIGAFGLGAGVAFGVRRICDPGHRPDPAVAGFCLALVALLLWAVVDAAFDRGAPGLDRRAVLAATGAFFMGCLGGLFARTAGIATTITYQSGTVMKTGTRVVAWIAGSGEARRKASQGVLLGLLGIGGYVSGSFVGALAGGRPMLTFALAAAVLVALMLTLRSLRRRR